MATLNTLRTKGGLIVTIAIGVALVAFLIGEAGRSTPQGGLNEKIGEINGQKITIGEYSGQLDYLTGIHKAISRTDNLNQEHQELIRNLTWKSMLDKYSLYPGYDQLGIQVSDQELFDLVYGENISPVLLDAGFFNDPQTGLYDKESVRQFIASFSSFPENRAIWQYIEDQVKDFALLTKYMGVISGMVYVTDAEANRAASLANETYDAKYVGKTYESIPDSLVQVSGAELKKYWEQHKNLYKQTASRDIEHVLFNVTPSVDDYTAVSRTADELARELAVTDNVAQYVALNSLEPFDGGYYDRSQLTPAMAEFAFSGNTGEVYGPVLEGDTYTIARVSDIRSLPDTLGLNQLILGPVEGAFADSLLSELNRGADFMTMSGEHSLMPGYTEMGRIPINFLPADVIDKMDNRSRFVRYDNPNGIVLFEVYYRTPASPKAQIGTIRYPVEPSQATQQAVYAKASGFYTGVAGSYDRFTKNAADSLYAKRVVRVRPTDEEVSGFANSKELVRWAYNAKEGDVSPIMELNGDYVIASLVTVREEGIAPANQLTRELTAAVRKEKKARMLVEQIRSAQSFEAVEQALEKPETGEIEGVTFNTFYLPGLMIEHTMIGALTSGLDVGELSKPIEGMTGVYVVLPTAKETADNTNEATEKVRIEANSENRLEERVEQTLVNLSGVKDNRVRYF